MFMAAMAALDKGQVDPVTEQLILGTINKENSNYHNCSSFKWAD